MVEPELDPFKLELLPRVEEPSDVEPDAVR